MNHNCVTIWTPALCYGIPPFHLSTMQQSLICTGGSLAVVSKAMQDLQLTIGSQLEVVEHALIKGNTAPPSHPCGHPMAHYKVPTHWPGAAASRRRLGLLQRESTFQDSRIPGFQDSRALPGHAPTPRCRTVTRWHWYLGAGTICYNEISSSWRAAVERGTESWSQQQRQRRRCSLEILAIATNAYSHRGLQRMWGSTRWSRTAVASGEGSLVMGFWSLSMFRPRPSDLYRLQYSGCLIVIVGVELTKNLGGDLKQQRCFCHFCWS